MFVPVSHSIKRAQSVRTSTKIMAFGSDGSCVRIPTSLPLGVWEYLGCLSLCVEGCLRAALFVCKKERGPKSPLKQRSSTATIPV